MALELTKLKEIDWRKAIRHRRSLITAGVLLVLVLLFTFVPSYVARHLVASTLNDFGIEHEGIKTIKINPWKLEVWAGPVRFRTGDADHGQLGELGIKVNAFPLFQKHALVERVLIRGIDIFVARAEDNTLTLNGISLSQFKPTAEAVEPAKPQKETKPWGIGLHEFEMQDSRLIFKEKSGGTLTVEIEKFHLGNFTSWLPDEPGTIALKASINQMQLSLNGQARPFAKHITINVDADARDADLPKIIEFTGPLGFERKDGQYNSTLHHEITLFDTGRLEGHSVGKVTLIGADYALADRFTLVTEQAEIDLDTRYSLSKTDDLKVDGKMTLDLLNASGNLPGENSFAIGTARVELTELSATHDADKTLLVAVKPRIDLKQGSYSGRVQLSMDALLDVLRYLQTLSSKTVVTAEQTGLDQWSGDEVTLPKSDITVAQLNTSISKFDLSTANGKVTLDFASAGEAADIKIVSKDRTSKINAAGIKVETLNLNSGEGKTGLKLAGNFNVTGTDINGPIGKGTIKTIQLSENLDLQINRGDIAVQGSAKAAVKGTQIRVKKTESLPQATVTVDTVTADIKNGAFSIANQKLKWQAEAGATIDSASVEYAKGRLSSAKFKRLELRGAKADQNLNIATDRLTISGLEASATRQFVDGVISDVSDDDDENKDKENDEDEVKKTADKPDVDKPVEFNLKLGRFELIKGAKLNFQDRKVEPPVIINLDIKTAEVRDIDSRNPKSTPYANLIAAINEFTHLELHGNAHNEGPKMDMELNSKLENLELPTYSSYAAEFAGVNLESGQFSTHVDVKANKGDLDGAIKLNIKDLEFTPLSKEDAERLSKTTGVPIETAARLLKDRNGVIDLSLPVSGTVIEPDVDISSAISKAVGNTLKAVFPPTLIGSMLSSVRKSGNITFKPIIFNPGASNLDKEAKEYLEELAELLKERPTMYLNICGRTTPEDFKEVTLISIKLKPNPKPEEIEGRKRLIAEHGPKLGKLATERSRVVRRYFINDKGFSVNQVGECRSVFNPDDTEPPRVMVTL